MREVIVTKMGFTKFPSEISQELLETTLKFIHNLFHCEFYNKIHAHGSHHALPNIFESGLIIKNVSTGMDPEILEKGEGRGCSMSAIMVD